MEYRQRNATTWTVLADGTTTATSALVSGLRRNAQYEFRVVGQGAYSDMLGAKADN